MNDLTPAKAMPPHVGPVRFLWAKAHHENYQAFESLAEARAAPDSVMIMEADSGGQILVTCPVARVHAEEAVLNQLLCDLEMISWGPGRLSVSDVPYDSCIYYELLPPGSGVGGGMGGGVVIEGVWVHEELEALGLRRQIEEILAGTRHRLGPEERVRKQGAEPDEVRDG